MHLYGHLLGIWCDPASSGHCRGQIDVEPQCLDEHGAVAMGALATLGDMAMQTSLLSAYPGQRLTTMLLQVRRYGLETCSVVNVAAQSCNAGEQAGFAHAMLKNSQGCPIGDLCGAFASVPVPEAWRPLPWEIGLERPVYGGPVEKATIQGQEIALVKGLSSLLESKTT